ncbi:MAG: hypothetical protein U0797_20200 [Gemmataceae bacterium]
MAASWSDNLARRWQEATTAREMAQCLAGVGSERKFRLLMCAAIRRLWPLALDPRSRAAVEAVQRYADGLATAADLQAAAGPAHEAYTEARGANHETAVANAAWMAALAAPPHEPHAMALTVLEDCRAACERNAHLGLDAGREQEGHAWLFRCVFGQPFRGEPEGLASWRAWNGGTAVQLARVIYDEQRFHVLPILADALEEAGCDDEALLAHCRDDGLHVRGCWVVDLLLDRA